MKKSIQKAQLVLMFAGIFLILTTYIIYPKFIKKNTYKTNIAEDGLTKKTESEKMENTFKNVEYKGKHGLNNSFVVKSESAYIPKENPNLVYMNNMEVFIYLENDRVVKIIADRGTYNKVSYDIFFTSNCIAKDEETVITSDNIDLLNTQETASVYNNVFITNKNGTLEADSVKYDFATRSYIISMFNSQKVKVKLIK